jgi:ribosomal protein L11 methyltransferase
MDQYIEIIFPVSGQAAKDTLVAQLSVRGFEGFEEQPHCVKAFIRESDFDGQELQQFSEEYALSFTQSLVENRNWNAEWESHFLPVVIAGFCAVRAAFHPPVDGVTYDIIITPKMSFGTGHHATTYMMVQAMRNISFAGRSVFDFGTGTGVLAVLAEKLGALTVAAIDNEDNSIENAAENLAANDCTRCTLRKADTMTGNHTYDIILANINRNVILQQLSHIRQHLAPRGVALLSGLLIDDQPRIMEEAFRHQLVLTRRIEREGWICLELGQQ